MPQQNSATYRPDALCAPLEPWVAVRLEEPSVVRKLRKSWDSVGLCEGLQGYPFWQSFGHTVTRVVILL